jgi:hypothetical protein
VQVLNLHFKLVGKVITCSRIDGTKVILMVEKAFTCWRTNSEFMLFNVVATHVLPYRVALQGDIILLNAWNEIKKI